MVDVVVDDHQLLEQAMTVVRRLAAFDGLAASEAYRLLHDASSPSLPDVIEREARLQEDLGHRDVFRSARHAFFESRRQSR